MGFPPQAQGYAPPQAAADKPIDPTRMIIGVVGCAALALYSVIAMTAERPSSGFLLFLSLVEVVGLAGIGVGLTGLRTMPSVLAAVASGLAASTVLAARALMLLEIRSMFLWNLTIMALHGWMLVAFAMFAVSLATGARKLGPVAFGGAGLFGVASLLQAYFFFQQFMFFLKKDMDPSPGAWKAAHIVHILGAAVAATALVLAITKAKSQRAS